MSAGPPRNQSTRESAAAVDHPAEIDVEHPVEPLCRSVQESPGRPDPGVVDHDVGHAVRGADLLGEAFDGVGVGDVQRIRVRHATAVANPGYGRRSARRVDIADQHLRTLGGECARRGLPDAAGRAGDRNEHVAEGFPRPTHLRAQQRPAGRLAIEISNQLVGGAGYHLGVRHRRPMAGADIAAPQPRHPPRGVVVDMGPDEVVLGVDQQLHRNRHVAVPHRAGQCLKEVGPVDLQTVGGIGDEGPALVALVRRYPGGDQVAVHPPGQE